MGVPAGRSCMTSRRAPEFAAGKFLEFVHYLLEISLGSLLFDLAADGVTGEHRATVLREFASARRHFEVDPKPNERLSGSWSV